MVKEHTLDSKYIIYTCGRKSADRGRKSADTCRYRNLHIVTICRILHIPRKPNSIIANYWRLGLFPPPMGFWQYTNWQIYTETYQRDTWESLAVVVMVKFVNFRLFWTCACEQQVVKLRLPLCWDWWVKQQISYRTIFCCCHHNMLSWHISQVLWFTSMEYR